MSERHIRILFVRRWGSKYPHFIRCWVMWKGAKAKKRTTDRIASAHFPLESNPQLIRLANILTKEDIEGMRRFINFLEQLKKKKIR